ncbi:MAG TPA: MgtC/SapB family protein [Chthonomonadaceae bacterium]|nr:MgtC/SapB family protein [Chthonomonadaceae bacterium]
MDLSRFFGLHVDSLSIGGQALALLLSMALSGLIGLERQWRGQSAGLRTHMLVGIGSTLITQTSILFGDGHGAAHGESGRLAAQIVSGIGFLGAAAIMRTGPSVHGLTTAASIWAVAAIGIAVGSSPRLGELAVVATTIVLVTLVVLQRIESALHLKHDPRVLHVEVHEAEHGPARLLALLIEQGFIVDSVTNLPGSASSAEPTRKMDILVRLPAGFDQQRCTAFLAAQTTVTSFEVE